MSKLQIAIALLPDAELSNRLSAAALGAHAASLGRLRWPRLPPHLSLKQPFAVESLPAVECAIEQLAREHAAIQVTLGSVEVRSPSPGSPEAVVCVGVQAGPSLLELERSLDSVLSPVAVEAPAPFVSDAYRFHVTLGFLPTPSLGPDATLPVVAGAVAAFPELGVFVYDGLPRAGWQSMLYARRSLSGGASARAADMASSP